MQKTQKIWVAKHRSNLLRSNHLKQKLVIFSIYKAPDYSNLLAFFKELRKYLNQASENYDNFIVMGNFNIDIRQTSPESHKLDEFGSLFSLTNITKSGTCFTKFHSSTIGLFLTNKPNFLQKKQTLSKLTLATITNSYVLFLNPVMTD